MKFNLNYTKSNCTHTFLIELNSVYQGERIKDNDTYLQITKLDKELSFDIIPLAYQSMFLNYTNLPKDIINIIYEYEPSLIDRMKEVLRQDLTDGNSANKLVLNLLNVYDQYPQFENNNLAHIYSFLNFKCGNFTWSVCSSMTRALRNIFINDKWFTEDEILSKLITLYGYYIKTDGLNTSLDIRDLFEMFIFGEIQLSYQAIDPIIVQIKMILGNISNSNNNKRKLELTSDVNSKKIKS